MGRNNGVISAAPRFKNRRQREGHPFDDSGGSIGDGGILVHFGMQARVGHRAGCYEHEVIIDDMIIDNPSDLGAKKEPLRAVKAPGRLTRRWRQPGSRPKGSATGLPPRIDDGRYSGSIISQDAAR